MKLFQYLLSLTFLFSILVADPPNWEDDPATYQYTATIAGGVVLNDGVLFSQAGDMFAAFDIAGNVRGLAVQIIPNFGSYDGEIVYEMQMRSNSQGDELSFKYYDASEDVVLNIYETYNFEINDIIGNLMEPVIFTINSNFINLYFDNLNSTSVDIRYDSNVEISEIGRAHV